MNFFVSISSATLYCIRRLKKFSCVFFCKGNCFVFKLLPRSNFFLQMFENQWSIIIRVLTVIQTLHKPNGFDAELQWKCSYCRFYCCKKAVTHVHSSHAFIKKIDLKTYSTYSASILLQLCTWIKFSLLSFEFISW